MEKRPNKKIIEKKSWKEDLTKFERLPFKAGNWLIEFLDNGRQYQFNAYGAEQTGISFQVNGKNTDTNENYPNVQWSVTAKSILRKLAVINDLVGYKLSIVATGEKKDRRYPTIELIAPAKQTKLKK